MAKKSGDLSSVVLLSVAVGAFLVLSGIQNLIEQNSLGGQISGMFVDKTTGVVNVVVSILKIVSGVVLVVGPFGLLTIGIRNLGFWIIVGFWAILTVWVAYAGIGVFKGDGKAIIQWFQNLSLNVAILAALWQLKPQAK